MSPSENGTDPKMPLKVSQARRDLNGTPRSQVGPADVEEEN